MRRPPRWQHRTPAPMSLPRVITLTCILAAAWLLVFDPRMPAPARASSVTIRATSSRRSGLPKQPRVFVYDCTHLHCDTFDPVPHTALEREMLDQLTQSATRVRRVEDADAAYIPVNMVSWYYNNTDGSVLDTHASYKQRTANLEAEWARWSQQLASVDVRARVPHFVLWPYVFYNVNITFLPADIRVLAYENVGLGGAPAHASYDNGCGDRCIVIPYLSTSTRAAPVPWGAYRSRAGLVSFAGSVARSSATRAFRQRIVTHLQQSLRPDEFVVQSTDAGLYGAADYTRGQTAGAAGPALNASTVAPEYVDLSMSLTTSKLCLQLAGDTVTRKGFYDAIAHGCAPVVFASSLAVYGRLLGGGLPVAAAVVTLADDLAQPGVPLQGVVDALRRAATNERVARARLAAMTRIQPYLDYSSHEAGGLALPFVAAVDAVIKSARGVALTPTPTPALRINAGGHLDKTTTLSTMTSTFHSAPTSGVSSLALLHGRVPHKLRQNCSTEMADGTSCRLEGACWNPVSGRWFGNVDDPVTLVLRSRWDDRYKNRSTLTIYPVSAATPEEAASLAAAPAMHVPGVTVLTRRYAIGNFGHTMLENVFPVLKMLTEVGLTPAAVDRMVLDDDCDDATDHELLFGYPNNGRNCIDYMRFLVDMLMPGVALHEADFLGHGRPTCFDTLALGVGQKSSLVYARRNVAVEETTSTQARRAIETYAARLGWQVPPFHAPRVLIHAKGMGNRHGAAITNAQQVCDELNKAGAACNVFSLDTEPAINTQIKKVWDADVFITDPGSSQYYSIFQRPGTRHVTFEKCLVPDPMLRAACAKYGTLDLAQHLDVLEKEHSKIPCAAVLPEVLESFTQVKKTMLRARPTLIRSMGYHTCTPPTNWSKAWFPAEAQTHGLNLALPPSAVSELVWIK